MLTLLLLLGLLLAIPATISLFKIGWWLAKVVVMGCLVLIILCLVCG